MGKRKKLFAAVLGVMLIMSQTMISRAEGTEVRKEPSKSKKKYVEGQILVKFKSGVSLEENINTMSNKYYFKKVGSINSLKIQAFNIPKNTNLENIINKLKLEKNIEFAQPNYIYYPDSFSTDPRASELWGLENNGQGINGRAGVSGVDLDITKAWTQTKGSESVVVGVIDTGIDINHPDLKDRIWTNTGEVPGNGIDDDGNGYIDDVNGWDFYNNDNSVYDVKDGDKHGTHVAGTIAASLNNVGVVGVAPKVKIMPLKFLGPFGGSTFDAVKAISYAKNKGVKVLNNSWGGSGYDYLLKDAIDSCNALFVAAAGNEENNNDVTPSYPASYSSSNILSVAAIDNRGNLASFSNFGATSVDVAAPGVNILSTIPKPAELGCAVKYQSSDYKAFTQGISMLNVNASQRDGLIKKVMDFFGANENSKILLVEDNGQWDNTAVENIYQTSLSNLGFKNITKYPVELAQDGPDIAALASYDVVIWDTGDSEYWTITEADKVNLSEYLKGGKGLYLLGNTLVEGLLNQDFTRNYLHIKYLFNDDNVKQLKGISGNEFDGMTIEVSNNYVDRIEPIDETAKLVLNYSGDSDYNSSYQYLHGTSMATPHVTGVAALLASKGINDPITIRDKIISGTVSLSGVNGYVATNGMVNAYNSLRLVKDYNNDKVIDISDLAAVSRRYNVNIANSAADKVYDLNEDGVVDVFDLVSVSKDFNR
ncbi:S8 family serine peptidase [Clostridium swellfunianum]|uniref:S8 family serine peptidase n=1 Tax=Clostridium swellfunianum TaxID=1367462 RepID=UPI00202F115A|nr:S8 family serine peptidase [Clostridium swellfunianum]MCM0647402.1 S8 family serine peptidase [Clostridium swellfunianum]